MAHSEVRVPDGAPGGTACPNEGWGPTIGEFDTATWPGVGDSVPS
jgi:hypothetical protein